MKTLFLSGHGVNLRVENSRLIIRDGCEYERREPAEYELRPKGDDYDSIVIYGHSGNISLEALKWLSKHNVQLTILNWDGQLLNTVLIPEIKKGATRFNQYKVFDGKGRVDIAKKFIDAKIASSITVLNWLTQRYPELKDTKKASFDELNLYKGDLAGAATISQILGIEGMVARNYWLILAEIFDKKWKFEGRLIGKTGRPMGATDPINALFNYGYSILESQCWRAINAYGLDPYIGFVHQMAAGKYPLVYDLQEPFRWLIDVAIIDALEKGMFTKKDFIRTDNYVIRLSSAGTKKLLEAVNVQFTNRVQFRGNSWEWGYVIIQKAGEFVHFISESKPDFDFSSPAPTLTRDDTPELRDKVLAISYYNWMKAGYSKGSLHYLKMNAKSEKPFRVYGKMKEKLDAYSN